VCAVSWNGGGRTGMTGTIDEARLGEFMGQPT